MTAISRRYSEIDINEPAIKRTATQLTSAPTLSPPAARGHDAANRPNPSPSVTTMDLH